MSWESSVDYERIINVAVRERIGGTHSADLIVRSYDFAEIETLQDSGGWKALAERLSADAVTLETAGAELLVIATNTMHVVAPQVQAAIGIPLIHIADATVDAIRAARLDTVALLGTRYTMELPFYRERLADLGIRVLVPDEPDRSLVHDVIYRELVRGVISVDSHAEYLRIIGSLRERGAQGVIAGCTEIELLLRDGDLDCPLFPTARLHALAAVDVALSD
jgi:aspartate racemase